MMTGDRGFQPEEHEPNKLHEMLAGEALTACNRLRASVGGSCNMLTVQSHQHELSADSSCQ
jgi:hypothetical protein